MSGMGVRMPGISVRIASESVSDINRNGCPDDPGIRNWKRRAQKHLPELFSKKLANVDASRDAEIKELHAKIGQLAVENDFLAKAFGR